MADSRSEEREPLAFPLDAADPRFAGSEEGVGRQRRRDLVESMGPGPSPMDARVRLLRVAIPMLFAAMLATIGAVFFIALDPGDGRQVVGREEAVRAAVAERPKRVCYQDSLPCAWVTVVGGRLLALNTSGTLNAELGRLGVGWCPSSHHFVANSTGSVYDQLGRVVRGPAPRGLDYVGVRVDEDGTVSLDFFSLTTNLQVGRSYDTLPATGPPCQELEFDRDADLELAGADAAP